MAKLAQLNEPARSPEREALAQAIARVQRAEQRVERVESVRHVHFVADAQDKLEAAQAMLTKARAQEGIHTVAALLDERPGGPSVEDGELAVTIAKEELAIAERTREAMDAEYRAAQEELEDAKRARRIAARHVVKAEGGMDKLLAAFETAKQNVEKHREVLSYLSSQNCMPNGWDAIRYYPITGADNDWKLAFLDLETDPDAQLP